MAQKFMAASLVFALSGAFLPAMAQDVGVSPNASTVAPNASTAAPNASTAAPNPSTVLPAAAANADPEVIPGPFQNERGMLLQKIFRARQQGMGITGYLGHFNAIQDMVKTGQPEPQVKQRIESVSKALDEQLERSKVLKTQRVPPATSGFSSKAAGGTAMAGGGGKNGSIDDLMAKYGKNLPPDVNKAALMKRIGEGAGGGGLPDDLMKKLGDKKDLLSDPRARELLQKLKAD